MNFNDIISLYLLLDIKGDRNMKIIVVGGDGFCGWPTALYLSKQGHDISVLDNIIRRKWD